MKKNLLFIIIVLLFIPMVGVAQEAGDDEGKAASLKLQQELLFKEQALESAIDPELYIVGPGDVFLVNIWGIVNENFKVMISPEGNLLIPTVTEFSVKKLTLAEVRQRIIDETQKVYFDSKVTVNLIKLRKFRIAVSGAVTMPGSYAVTAVDRAYDGILAAGGFLVDETMWRQEPSLRNIQLLRDADTLNVDLLAYQQIGDRDANPYLLDGDVVYVPLIEKNIGFVEIYGSVNNEGRYEFSQGDRLLDIIKIAHGLRYDTDKNTAEITRFKNSVEFETFNVDLNAVLRNPASKDNLILQPDDRIFIRSLPDYHEKNYITIRGEVKYPGNYVIEEGETKLSDIITEAGGFTGLASLQESRLIRRAREEVLDPEFERLKLMAVEEMTNIEYEYFKTKSRQTSGIVAADFVKLFIQDDTSQDILLRNRDIIQIQPLTETVNIIGAVGFSGITTYIKNKDLGYYIQKAGGYSWSADKSDVRLIKASTGEWAKADENTTVELGDTIFVPEKPKRDWWAIFKDTLQVTTQVTALLIVVQNIMSN